MVGIGLVGAGGMAGVYADRIAAIDGASVVGVASPNTAAEFVAERGLDATAHDDAAALCADPAVEAVAVLTPTHTHADVVEEAADAGVDVLCEKPLARTLEGADAIAEAVEAAGITLMVAHVIRFFPEYAAARERVAAGEIGVPGVARARRAFGFSGDRGWFDDPEKSGGVLLDLAVHDFDYLRWVLGDVERVFARRVDWTNEGNGELAVTVLRFADGTVGHVETAAVTTPSVPFSASFEFAGDEGLVEFDLDDVAPVRRYGAAGVHVPRDPVGDDLPLREDGYRRQLEAFLDCVESGTDPPVGIEEGRRSMRVSLAAIASAERGRPVAPAEVGR